MTTTIVQGTSDGGERLEGRTYFPSEIHGGGGVGDTLVGGYSSDVLHDDGGQATLVGGWGDDQYHVTGNDDLIVEVSGDPPVHEYEGIDTVFVTGSDYELPAGLENLVLVDGIAGTGNAAPNRITGNAGDNTLDGAAPGLVEGWRIGDSLVGGAGNDVYILHSLRDRVVELSGGGHDTIVHRDPTLWAAGYELPAEVEDFRVDNPQVEGLWVIGNALDNHLVTTDSDDSLFGGAGTDTLAGLGGNDKYYVDRADDVVIEASGAGDLDEVRSTAPSYVLPDHVEVLRMSGAAVEGTGNDLPNLIQGRESANWLAGMGGNDTLHGGYGGDDTFVGGAGDDMIHGDRGYDTVIFSGKMADYLVTRHMGHLVTVEGADGRDVLQLADRLVFDDGELLLNHRATGQAAIVGTLQSGATLTGSLGGLIEPDGVQSINFSWELDGTLSFDLSFGETLQIGELPPGYHSLKLTVGVTDKLGFSEQFTDRIEIGTPPVDPPPFDDVPAQLLEIETLDDGLTVLLHFDKAPRLTLEPAWIELWGSSEDMVRLAVPGGEASLEGTTLRVHLPRPFEPGEQVWVQLSGHFEVINWRYGAPLAWFKAWAPDDVDLPGPTPLSLLVEDALTGVFEVAFRERVMPASGQVLLKDSAGNVIERFDVQDADVVEFIGTWVRLHSVQFLEAGRAYTLEFPAGVLLDPEGVPAETLQFALDTGVRIVYGAGTGDGPDRLFVGDERQDHLFGSSGDTLVGAGGNDWLAGWQDGLIALYQGVRSDYRIEKMDPAVQLQPSESFSQWWVADQIAGRDGTDAVFRVAWLQFEDYRVDLRIGELAAALPGTELRLLQELYVAFFDRIPEAGGLSFWLGEMKAGASLSAVAERFHDAGVQFGVFPAGQTNEAFIQQLYVNVLGRDEASDAAPTADEIAYWLAPLESGVLTRGTLVVKMLQDVHTWFDGHTQLGWVERLLDNKGALAHWYAVEQGLGLHTAQDDIAFGQALAALVTPEGFEAAVDLVGVGGVAGVGFA